MKRFAKTLILILAIGLAVGCTKDDESYIDDSAVLKKAQVRENNRIRGLDQDRFITMDEINLKVHYRIIGKGPIDLVFLPGWTNPLTVYTKQFDYFRDKARCIYIDLPGQGLSDAPTPNNPLDQASDGLAYTHELMAEAVFKIIKKEGLHQFVAVGFSMGPRVWGMFEKHYPGLIHKLVVIDGGFNPWPTDPAARDLRIAIREGTYMAQLEWDEAFKTIVLASLIPPELQGEDAEQLKEWGAYFPPFPSDIMANIYYYHDAENANEPVGWMYPKLCFYSKEVSDINMDKVNLIYPNNTVYGFPGGGHVIHWMFHEEINPIIWEFIKDHPGKKY